MDRGKLCPGTDCKAGKIMLYTIAGLIILMVVLYVFFDIRNIFK